MIYILKVAHTNFVGLITQNNIDFISEKQKKNVCLSTSYITFLNNELISILIIC